MVIYRGVKNLLYKNINILFKNEDDSLLDYGMGTSYSYEKNLAEEYAKFGSSISHGWILTYNFEPKNPLFLTNSNTVDEDCFDFGIFLEGSIIEKKELSQYAINKGHDCVIFEYDEYDPHILIVNASESQFELKEAILFTENQEIVDNLKKLKLPFDGEFFIVKESKIKEVDSTIEPLI